MKKIKIMSVFGTRPEAIKMAPLVKALAQREYFESICCLTGQHREMLDSVMEIFQLRGDYDLNIMEKRQTLSTITTKTILGMDDVIDQAQPDMILVHGDRIDALAGDVSTTEDNTQSGAQKSVQVLVANQSHHVLAEVLPLSSLHNRSQVISNATTHNVGHLVLRHSREICRHHHNELLPSKIEKIFSNRCFRLNPY